VLDQDGFPQLPAGRTNFQGASSGGVTRLTFRMSSPAQLVGSLALGLRGARVIDTTGLTGKYDFKLDFAVGGLSVDGHPAR